MNSIIQLLVIAGIAVFLILRLRSVLGTRDGFEKPPVPMTGPTPAANRPEFEVIEGGPDRDITDHVDEGSQSAEAFAKMKGAESSFAVGEFIQGARGAYEMIVMAYEAGDLASIQPYIDGDVYDAFAGGVSAREDQGLSIEAKFMGVRETTVEKATFDDAASEAQITLKFVAELTSIIRDRGGDIIEGSDSEIKRQKDSWTFARTMGKDDPNWILVATGE